MNILHIEDTMMPHKSATITACIIVLFVCLLSTVATVVKPKRATSGQRHHNKRFFGPSRYHYTHKKPWTVRPSKTGTLSEFQQLNLKWPSNPNEHCFTIESPVPGMGSDRCAARCGTDHGFGKGAKVRVTYAYFPAISGYVGPITKWLCKCCATKL